MSMEQRSTTGARKSQPGASGYHSASSASSNSSLGGREREGSASFQGPQRLTKPGHRSRFNRKMAGQKKQQQQHPKKTSHQPRVTRGFANPAEAAKQSAALKATLKARGCYETPEQEQKRCESLDLLERILCQWEANLNPENILKQPRPTLITFGSYRLGAHRPDSDLDVLALTPQSCSRGEFFNSLVKLLEADPAIEFVHSIQMAFTPVIKMKLTNGLDVDMLHGGVVDPSKLLRFHQERPASLSSTNSSTEEPRPEYIIDDSDFTGTDETGVRTLNGTRVTQMILEVVPNLENFRITLMAVKEWAVVTGIYSNVLGFLGGVNFAILVALVCSRHPEKEPSTLLRIFFRTFAMWKWPNPVMLPLIQTKPPPGAPYLPSWNPEGDPRDARHVMPIITPAYPSMNSSYNVAIPQRRRIIEEMVRAALILENGESGWKRLFQSTDFFQRHSNFLQITVKAEGPEDSTKWLRFCESKLRLLIAALETPQVSAWPFAKKFKRTQRKNMMPNGKEDGLIYECSFFIALRFNIGVESINLRYATVDFLRMINSWEERKKGMDFAIAHVLQEDLPDFVLQQIASNTTTAATQEVLPPMTKNQRNKANSTRLTPKMARSALSDETVTSSPAKRARCDDGNTA